VLEWGKASNLHRELGKHCSAVHRRALMQLRAYGGRPLLTVGDRCELLPGACRGTTLLVLPHPFDLRADALGEVGEFRLGHARRRGRMRSTQTPDSMIPRPG
jgi:hypothetical protein